MFSIIEKATGNWVGRLGPWRPNGWPGTEIGWGLARSAWGKGYATEGAAAAMDYVVDHLGWTEIIHTILPENTGSIKVAERLGSRYRCFWPIVLKNSASGISMGFEGILPIKNNELGEPGSAKLALSPEKACFSTQRVRNRLQ